jgi:hypothetical protein
MNDAVSKPLLSKFFTWEEPPASSPVTMSAAATEAKMNRASVVTPKIRPVIGCGIFALVRHGSEIERRADCIFIAV